MEYRGASGIDMGGTKVTTLGPATATTDATNGSQAGGVYVWSGSAWVIDADVRIFIQKTGDPAPTGLATNDLVLEE